MRISGICRVQGDKVELRDKCQAVVESQEALNKRAEGRLEIMKE